MNRLKSFIFNGILLTAVSLLMRTVSVSFNVYISNKIGAEAMGLFTLISTVYGFGITVATSGIGLAVTRLVSEALGKDAISPGKEKNSHTKCIMRQCAVYSLVFSISAGLILFFFSDIIGKKILDDARTVSSLRLLSFTLVPIALSSVLSGYFVAVRRVYKNAAIQFSEQLIKIFLTVFLLTAVFASDVESACIAVVLGGAVGEIISFMLQYILYASEKKYAAPFDVIPSSKGEKRSVCPAQYAKSTRLKLLHIALPVAFSTYVRSGLVTLEHILIPSGLEKSGSSKSISLAAYGTIHSMVFPVIFFPSAILSSFSGLLVPEVSEAQAANDNERIKRIVSGVFRTALVFSIGVAGIMLCFSYPLGSAVYPDSDAGQYIRMIAPLIPVMYLDTSVDSMLKGLGEQVYSMGVNIVDALMSVILVIILLPRFGITGYIITVYFTEILNATLSITRLLNVSGIKPRVFSWVLKPLISVIASSSAVKYLLARVSLYLPGGTARVVFLISSTVCIYIALIFITGTVKTSEAKAIIRRLKKRSDPDSHVSASPRKSAERKQYIRCNS